MAQTSKSLDEQKSAEKKLLRDLSVVATAIKQSDRRVISIKNKKKELSEQLVTAQRALRETKREMAQLNEKVSQRLVSLYKEGDTGPLKLFFSSESPMELAEQYQYLTLVLKHDRKLLNQFRAGLERQREKESRYETLQAEQDTLLGNEKKNRQEAEQARKLYSQILNRVRTDQKSLAKELDSLKSRARRLEKLVRELKPTSEKPASDEQHFASLKGLLPWPVKGRVAIGFGTQHSQELGTVLESNGIEINYKAAQPVKVVASGRIVFASWFKGYGNLIIVAHDGGYHTLYAQLEKLSGGVGDVVRQGDTIARTGDPRETGVYFEIRHNGTPIDPTSWLGAN